VTHLAYTLLAASLLSLGTAMVENRSAHERLTAAVRTLLGCAVAIVGGGWLMRLIHG
jgi:hypothetical protein